MRFYRTHAALVFATSYVFAQGSTDAGALTFTDSVVTLSGSRTASATRDDGAIPTESVTYLSVTSTSTVSSSTGSASGNSTATGISSTVSSDSSGSSRSSTSQELTLLGGGSSSSPSSGKSTASSTSSSARPTNTQACNGYPEFCSRKYSNITEVTAHNSPFVRRGNAASNQQLTVTYQLNDGIRMLQGQTHKENGTMYYCHTSCDLLNGGTVEDYLATVYQWVSVHPYDVVTILIGNGDNVDVENFVDPIQNSGLGRFAYEPPKVPMALNDWPTLSEMILTQKRVVFFMDYNANQTKVPYVLDEFSQLWETPFSPTNSSFPCSSQRPPNLSTKNAKERMYMANHNLNTEVSIGSFSLLIPTTALLNETNNVTGNISLGDMAERCTEDWGRPPNFLLVDYYNIPNGTVFEVAAKMNNVTYTGHCCGTIGQQRAAAATTKLPIGLGLTLVVALFVGSLL